MRGQVWVETVVYTLVGLSLIGIVLAFVTPKINEYRDRAAIEQTINSLNLIDQKINEVLEAPGNTRVIELQLKKGALSFDSSEERVLFVLEDSNTIFSEPGENIALGRINVLTEKNGRTTSVSLSINYTIDLSHDSTDGKITLLASPRPYRISFTNQGFSAEDGRPVVFIDELSGT